jgi:hypothetical protein
MNSNSNSSSSPQFLGMRIGKIIMMGLIIIALIFTAGECFETVDGSEIIVVQFPNGKQTVYNTPGIKWQGFGSVTRYRKSFQYWFSRAKDQGKDTDQSIKARFTDGGHGFVSGSCRIDIPLDPASMIVLHNKYRSQEAIEQQLVRTTLEKAVYMTGTLMSSKESASSKRNDLLTFIADQAEKGVYKTQQKEVAAKDSSVAAIEGKTTTVVEILKDKNGQPLRQEVSPFASLHIGFSSLSINALDYDDDVEKQIKSQQVIAMQAQTSMARAKTAEQQVYTTEKEGEALAAKAKWTQEAIKATKVTEGEQELAVQELKTKKAASYKQEQILIGQGDAERKHLAFTANGALETKLDAWLKAQQYMWEAFGDFKGNLVPLYQSGVTNGGGANAQMFMQLQSMKAAKDLGLDLTQRGGQK